MRASYGEAGPVVEEADLGRIINDLGTGEEGEVEGEAERDGQPEVDETDSGIVKLCNQIIIDGYNKGASDIHVEPYGKTDAHHRALPHRRRLRKYLEVPAPHRNALVQRLKIMAKLDIAEKRKPQDGKIRFRGPMGTIELRVATIPTSGGNEDVVMRILAASQAAAPRQDGLPRSATSPSSRRSCRSPTASASWWARPARARPRPCTPRLGFINTEDMKIWTAEDPVEITQPGLRQVQVHPKIDFTFAAAMRSFLRADPDVIMVGEMRDHETAATGIEASLTGHLVFSTLHTNSAPETIIRLLDMDIDPFNFADALLGIMRPAPGAHAVRGLQGGVRARRRRSSPSSCEEYGAEHWDKVGVSYSPSLRLLPPQGLPQVRRLAATRGAWASTSCSSPRTR